MTNVVPNEISTSDILNNKVNMYPPSINLQFIFTPPFLKCFICFFLHLKSTSVIDVHCEVLVKSLVCFYVIKYLINIYSNMNIEIDTPSCCTRKFIQNNKCVCFNLLNSNISANINYCCLFTIFNEWMNISLVFST